MIKFEINDISEPSKEFGRLLSQTSILREVFLGVPICVGLTTYTLLSSLDFRSEFLADCKQGHGGYTRRSDTNCS